MGMSVVENPLDKLPEIFKRDQDQNLCVCNERLEDTRKTIDSSSINR